jgi:hypothetical protein
LGKRTNNNKVLISSPLGLKLTPFDITPFDIRIQTNPDIGDVSDLSQLDYLELGGTIFIF